MLPLVLLVSLAAVTDIHRRRIPNWLTLTGALLGFWLNGPAFASLGLVLGFCFYLGLYLLKAASPGDVKLMGAVGALTGWWGCCEVMLVAAILGLLVALVCGKWPGLAKRGVPHGAVIAAAVMALFLLRRIAGIERLLSRF